MASVSAASAEYYYTSSSIRQQRYFLDLLSSINIRLGYRCLDIGCGTGNATSILVTHVGKEGHVIGIDPDEKRIAVAIEKHSSIPNLEFRVAKSIDFPQCIGGYDVVISNAVFHWIMQEEKIQTLKNVFDALKHGGVFAFNLLKEMPVNSARLLNHCPKAVSEFIYGNFHLESLHFLTEMSTNSGFDIVSAEEVTYQLPFSTEDDFFDWLDATFYGKCNTHAVYAQHKDTIKLETFNDGRIKHEIYYFKIILKKP